MTDLSSKFDGLYADVALPVPIRRSFTYRLNAAHAARAKIGSRVIVPFGKRLLTGYVLDISDSLTLGSDIDPSKIKPVRDVLDHEPLLTKEIIELARWTADYYLSFIGEVLRASLPAGMSRKAEQHFSITPHGSRFALRSAAASA